MFARRVIGSWARSTHFQRCAPRFCNASGSRSLALLAHGQKTSTTSVTTSASAPASIAAWNKWRACPGTTCTGTRDRACFSTDSADKAVEHAPVDTFIYQGPFSRVVRMIKLVSVTSSSLALSFVPLSTYIGDESVPTSAKLIISGTVAVFAISTTGILHWFTSRYIRSIKCTKQHAAMIGFGDDVTEDSVEPEVNEEGFLKPIPLQIETFNFFGMSKILDCNSDELQFHVSLVTPTSFVVKDRAFWMHEELVAADWRLHVLFAPLLR